MNAPVLREELAGCHYDAYLHAWDTEESRTKNWWKGEGAQSKLTDDQIALMHPNVVIEPQVLPQQCEDSCIYVTR